MMLKENQPQLHADIALVFTLPHAGDRQAEVPPRNMLTTARKVLFLSKEFLGSLAFCSHVTPHAPYTQSTSCMTRGAWAFERADMKPRPCRCSAFCQAVLAWQRRGS